MIFKFKKKSSMKYVSIACLKSELAFNLIIRIPVSRLLIYEGCSNMNASSFITFVSYMLDKMVYVSIKDYMSPLNWHQT